MIGNAHIDKTFLLGPQYPTSATICPAAIYIVHPPLLVALALAWRTVDAPPALKFLVTGTATCFACYLLASLLLLVPGTKRVL
jgi:hypothetical protein